MKRRCPERHVGGAPQSNETVKQALEEAAMDEKETVFEQLNALLNLYDCNADTLSG